MPMHKRTCVKCLIFLAILLASTGVVTGYSVLQAESIPLEVKEPLEILPYASSLSLFPGETLQFNVEVENHASIAYNASLIFSLNDTDYQEMFVSFSDNLHAIVPGTNSLEAWLSVSHMAPAAELELTICITRDIEPQPKPAEPANGLAPSARLFSAGAKWAAGNGTSVLYINWFDNYCSHHLSDGVNWGPWWREGEIEAIKNSTARMLEQQGFSVTCVGDVPGEISVYDLVVFEAWFAIEPKHVQLVREYLAEGGNIVVLGGAPCYFSTYCRDMWPYKTGGQNLSSLQDWFGSAYFVNSGGTANLAVDKPFGTMLENQSQVYYIDAYGCYALISMNDDSQVIARWGDGAVFAFTNEYGAGRVYYQAELNW
ncbi:MAG TPA: hypothetical protein VF893_06000 [Candidatus Bathyarchaeia archaeon]